MYGSTIPSMSTPWGRSQHYTRFDEGFGTVSTAGHGGFVATKEYALTHFTAACRKRAEKQGGFYFWEEDCLYTLPALESEPLWPEIFRYATPATRDERRQQLITTISRWHPDYLLERGVAVDPEAYQAWTLYQQTDRRRAERDPDVIVAAVYAGEYAPGEPRQTRVTTADGKQHLVTSASYKEAQKGYPLMLLSKCELVVEEK